MGQQTNRTVRSTVKTILNKIPDRLIQRNRRVSKMIPAAKAGDIEPLV
jgi:hypothetical protein